MRFLTTILLLNSFIFAQNIDHKNDLKLYKDIEFHKYFFHIYDLKVYSIDAQRPDFKKPHLFHFSYKRNIDAQNLIDTTISEWDRLQLCKLEHAKNWGEKLKSC